MQEPEMEIKEKKAPVRILQVLDYINHNSGVSAVVMNYYSHMNQEAIKCDFLLYEKPEEEIEKHLHEKGAKIYATGQPSGADIIAYRKRVDAFFLAHAKEYDVVHVHIPNAAFAVLGSAQKYGIPVRILHSHNARGADGTIKKIRNYVLNKWGICYANRYFACSMAAGRYLYGNGKCDRNQVVVLNNAIDLSRYQYNEEIRKSIRASLGVGDEILLGHIGRFAEQKNHGGLLDIFAGLKKRGVRSKLVLLGDGPLQEEIRERVKREGMEQDVIFAGVVTNAEAYLSAMDIFLLPSLYEGLPVVCVEAQAAGLPCVISTDVTQEIAFTESVYFVERQDTEGWCERICQIAEQPPARYPVNGMGDYDIRVQAKRLEEMYLSYEEISNTDVHI